MVIRRKSSIYKKLYEITTYRIDGSYRDKRRPERVYFTNEIKNDLSRRDFTALQEGAVVVVESV